MSEINIESLATQFEGRKFGELVLYHIKNQSFEQIIKAMQGTIDSLPSNIQNEIESLLDNANLLAYKKEFWADDCGQILKFIVSAAQKELEEKGVIPTEDNLFDVFNLIVMNFAYSAYKDPKMKKFINTSIRKGIFNWILG